MSLLLLFTGTQAVDAVFTGTTTITFSQTGALAGTSKYSSTTTITFAQTGAFSGGFTNSATTTIVFSQTGDLKGNTTLSVTVPIVFSQTGALKANSNAGTGTAVITFSQTGAFNNSPPFAGSTTIVFSQTGAFSGGFTNSSTTTITFGTSGLFHALGLIIGPFTGTDKVGAHEYFPWHNPDGVSVYFNKGGHHRKRYFPHDIERQDVLVRKELSIDNPTTIQELDWDVYNYFEVILNKDVEFVFSNPRDNSDFVILLTKDANANVRNITWPASLVWPSGVATTSLSSSEETKLFQISYFGSRYRATLY